MDRRKPLFYGPRRFIGSENPFAGSKDCADDFLQFLSVERHRRYTTLMSLRLYNTLTKQEEEFSPLRKGKVTMYTCGPTVYGRPHIGNYASFLMADLLRRWLEAGHGYSVTHVKNITDVGHLLHDADHGDDKIQKEAEKEKIHPLDIPPRY